MTPVFLVTGSQGESIHLKKWNVRLFDSKEKADDFIIEKTAEEKAKVNNKNLPVFYHLETLELE